jgi:hypothetical protein
MAVVVCDQGNTRNVQMSIDEIARQAEAAAGDPPGTTMRMADSPP